MKDKYSEYKTTIEPASIAEAKSNFSEYISRVVFANEKLIITKRGKPVAGLVSLEDIKRFKQESEAAGLSQAIGKWENFGEIKSEIKKTYTHKTLTSSSKTLNSLSPVITSPL